MSSPYRLHHGPRSSHQQINRLLRQTKPSPILDVGAAHGIIGQTLQGSGLTIDAVEPNPAWAESAKPFYRNVFNCMVEDLPAPPTTYGGVVFADVLEHVADPLGVLMQVQRFTIPGATVIVSLPNITHLAVRLTLLAGRFPQMDNGIFDRTHLHQYTKDTAADLLRSAGLTIERISATPVPIDALAGSGVTRALATVASPMQNAAVKVWPRMFAMQWIFVARTKGS